MTNQILSVTSTEGKVRKVVAPVKTVTPIASPFACKLSLMLRQAPQRKRQLMVEQLINSGITDVDGWSITNLLTGRIDARTGNRVFPEGKVAGDRPPYSGNDGRYYGSRTYAPVTSLYQTGVIWSPAS